MKGYVKAISLGVTVIVDILMPTMIGYFLDQHFQSAPILIVVGLFLGVGCAFMTLYQLSKSYESK